MNIRDIVVERLGMACAVNLDEEIYKAVCHHLNVFPDGEILISEICDRGRFIGIQGSPLKTFYMDDTPLLEIHPIQTELTGHSMTVTQSVKRLYDWED